MKQLPVYFGYPVDAVLPSGPYSHVVTRPTRPFRYPIIVGSHGPPRVIVPSMKPGRYVFAAPAAPSTVVSALSIVRARASLLLYAEKFRCVLPASVSPKKLFLEWVNGMCSS